MDRLSRALAYSLAGHALIFILFFVRAYFLPEAPLESQAAIRVDLVALPDKLPPQEAVLPAPPPPAEKVDLPDKTKPAFAEPLPEIKKPDVGMTLPKKNDQKQKSALAKLKQMSALENLQNEVLKEAKPKREFKGNQISKGTQLTGLTRLEADDYISAVETHIRKNWALPNWLANKQLKAQVQVRFDEKGQIVSVVIVKSSGQAQFDEIVVDTVQKSTPLPAPPEKFVRLMNLEGILFGFPE